MDDLEDVAKRVCPAKNGWEVGERRTPATARWSFARTSLDRSVRLPLTRGLHSSSVQPNLSRF